MMLLNCPPNLDLQGFLNQTLGPDAERELAAHIDRCALCQLVLDRLTAEASRVRERRKRLSGVMARGVTATADLPEPDTDQETPEETQLINGRPQLAPAQLVLKPDVPGFRVDAEIGRGGMGVVYRGLHKRLNRPVAIKMVLAGGLADPRVTQRFLFEAEVLARVVHPQVVQVYEAGVYETPGGVAVPYLAMELLSGGTLHAMLKGPRIPPLESATLIAGLARAAHATHLQGVVHRDIKPANVLRGVEGGYKLADFGLAKMTASAGDNLTGTGMVVGTPSYMSPEQAKGAGEIGPASDTYSLGAVLYEMLTGRPPFSGGEPMSLLMRVISEPPAEVRALSPEVPRDLAAVTMKCLAKDPRGRYASAEALADDLDRAVRGLPTVARPLRNRERLARWCRRNPLVASHSVALVLTLIGTFVGTTVLRLRAEEDAERARVGERLAASNEQTALRERAAADRANAYLEFDQGARWCEQGRPDEGMGRFVRALERAERVGDRELARVIRINIRNWDDALFPEGRPLDLGPGGTCRAAAYSPDGKLIAVGSDHDAGVKLCDAATGEVVRRLYPAQASYAEELIGSVASATAFDPAYLKTWALRYYDGLVRAVDHHLGRGYNGVAFSADGNWLVGVQYDGLASAWELTSGRFARLRLGNRMDLWDCVADPAGGFWIAHERGVQSWNPATGRRGPVLVADGTVNGLKLRPAYVIRLLPSSDGKSLFAGDRAGQVVQWDTATRRPVAAWQIDGWVADLTAAPLSAGPQVMAMSAVGTVFQLDQPGTTNRVMTLAQARGHALAMSGDSRVLVVGDGDGNVTLYDTYTGLGFRSPLHVEGSVRTLQFHPTAREFFIASGNGVRVFPLPWPAAVPLALPQRPVVALAARAAANRPEVLAATTYDSAVFDGGSGRPGGRFNDPDGIIAAAFHPTDPTALHGFRGRWHVYDYAQKKVIAAHDIPSYTGAHSFAVRPKTGEIYVNIGPQVRVYPADAAGPSLRTIPLGGLLPGEPAKAIAFDPTGEMLIVAHGNRVDFLSPETGATLRPGIKTADDILSAAVSADGRVLATGHRDNTAQVWAVATGQPVFASPLNHARAVASVALSPDGRVILTGCRDGTSQVFDVATQLPLGPTRRYRNPVTVVSWGGTPDTFAVGAAGGEACVWPLATDPTTATLDELRDRHLNGAGTLSRFVAVPTNQ